MQRFFEMRESRKDVEVSAHELRIVFAVFCGNPVLVFAIIFLEPALHAEIEVVVYCAEGPGWSTNDVIRWVYFHNLPPLSHKKGNCRVLQLPLTCYSFVLRFLSAIL